MSVLDPSHPVLGPQASTTPPLSSPAAFKRLLVVMDTSAASHTALRRAQMLATQHRASLTLLHVVATSRLRVPLPPGAVQQRVAAARTTLERMAARLSTEHGLAVRTLVDTGDAFERLHALAAQTDLLVLGVRRRNPLRDLFLRTPTERLLRTYPCPLLLTKAEPAGPYRELLLPVDLSPNAEASLRTACALAPLGAIELLHVIETPRAPAVRLALPTRRPRSGAAEGARDAAHDHAVQQLFVLAQTAAGRGVRLTVRRGDAVAHSLAQQDKSAADLMVVAKDGDSSLGSYLLGQVARRLVATAWCDVLVVPAVAKDGAAEG